MSIALAELILFARELGDNFKKRTLAPGASHTDFRTQPLPAAAFNGFLGDDPPSVQPFYGAFWTLLRASPPTSTPNASRNSGIPTICEMVNPKRSPGLSPRKNSMPNLNAEYINR